MKWIQVLEKNLLWRDRRNQTGDDCTFIVRIQSAWIDRDRAMDGAGSGITSDSVDAGEWNELHAKTRMVQPRPHALELLETTRYENGEILFVDAHRDRLFATVEWFGLVSTGARLQGN
jgi:para-aminobenzoate synthetase/4-amino-4-deoxychorismate lyase